MGVSPKGVLTSSAATWFTLAYFLFCVFRMISTNPRMDIFWPKLLFRIRHFLTSICVHFSPKLNRLSARCVVVSARRMICLESGDQQLFEVSRFFLRDPGSNNLFVDVFPSVFSDGTSNSWIGSITSPTFFPSSFRFLGSDSYVEFSIWKLLRINRKNTITLSQSKAFLSQGTVAFPRGLYWQLYWEQIWNFVYADLNFIFPRANDPPPACVPPW